MHIHSAQHNVFGGFSFLGFSQPNGGPKDWVQSPTQPSSAGYTWNCGFVEFCQFFMLELIILFRTSRCVKIILKLQGHRFNDGKDSESFAAVHAGQVNLVFVCGAI